MLIPLDSEAMKRVKEHLALETDAEELDENEYNVALDDETEMEIALEDKGINVQAVVKLAYDEGLDGWYITGQIEDKDEVLRLAKTWTPLTEG